MTDSQESGRNQRAQSSSLYRKYRPRSFDPAELVGQEHIARTLRNAIGLGRIAHAYLFCGPRGTGKTSTARLLAKAVNCLDPDPWARPCNACTACEAINTGSAVDIVEIDAASNRGVDDVRDLREKVKYAPSQLRVKFYIIDEAHQLTRDAFNAFLKTLEEPPPHVAFVLATTEPDKLPDTVASRCQRFDFHRIPLSSMLARLRWVCQQEGIEIDDDALALIARQATGSLRDALGLLERMALFAEGAEGRVRITAEAVRQALGLSRDERLAGLVDALIRRNAGAGLRIIAEAAEDGEDLQQFGRQITGYLRTLLHLRAGGRDELADPAAREQAERFSLAELATLVRIYSGLELVLPRSGLDPQLPLELATVEAVLRLSGEPGTLATPARDASEAHSLAQPATASRSPRAPGPAPATAGPASGPAVSPREPDPDFTAREDAPPMPQAVAHSAGNGTVPREVETTRASAGSDSASEAAVLEKLIASWAQIRREVKASRSQTAALLTSVDPALVAGDDVYLVSPYEFHRSKLNEEVHRRLVESVISRYLGRAYRVHCVAPEEVPAIAPAQAGPNPEPAGTASMQDPAPESQATHRSRSPEDEARLQAAKSIFDAEEIG
uniref:DNA polymerase III subunit gamma/tau n=1 Tax=Thermorudis peleae TaxID=1382356 RepID=A0A831T858_9BACT